jgi:hypothetical protein
MNENGPAAGLVPCDRADPGISTCQAILLRRPSTADDRTDRLPM